jgi:hypothetical protein
MQDPGNNEAPPARQAIPVANGPLREGDPALPPLPPLRPIEQRPRRRPREARRRRQQRSRHRRAAARRAAVEQPIEQPIEQPVGVGPVIEGGLVNSQPFSFRILLAMLNAPPLIQPPDFPPAPEENDEDGGDGHGDGV